MTRTRKRYRDQVVEEENHHLRTFAEFHARQKNYNRWIVYNQESVVRIIRPNPDEIAVEIKKTPKVKIPLAYRQRRARRRNLKTAIAQADSLLTTLSNTYARGRYNLRPRRT